MKIFLYFMSVILTLFVTSCNKCDDLFPSDCDDCYQKLYGEWTLNYFATNGIDSVAFYDSLYQTPCKFNFEYYNKNTDFSFGPGFGISWGNDSNYYFFFEGAYSRITKESYLPVALGQIPISNTNNPFEKWNSYEWKLNKLSETDLWIELENSSGKFEMHMNK